MRSDRGFNKFHLILFLFVLSILILIFVPGLFSILLGWDGLGVTSYLLVSYFRTPVSNKAGFITLATNRLGDVIIIARICLISHNLLGAIFIIQTNWSYSSLLVWLSWALAAITKRAQIPFSAWLPAAMAAPTPVSSLVHSSTLVTAGCYLLIRWYPRIQSRIPIEFLLLVGCLTCCIARVSALVETDFKKMIALSTLSQLGLMFLRLSLGSWLYCWLHLLIHAYFKASIFIVAGVIIHDSGGYQGLKLQYSALNVSPLSFIVITTSSFSLIGLPFMAGFYSKDMILEKLRSLRPSVLGAILSLACCLLTSFYTIRVIYITLRPSVLSKKRNLVAQKEDGSFQVKRTAMLWVLAIISGPILFNRFRLTEVFLEWNSSKSRLVISVIAFLLLAQMLLKLKLRFIFFVSNLTVLSYYWMSGSLANYALMLTKFSNRSVLKMSTSLVRINRFSPERPQVISGPIFLVAFIAAMYCLWKFSLS